MVFEVAEARLASDDTLRRCWRRFLEGDDAYKSSIEKVFSAGDMRRGQSLVVWAIREGRQCARAIDEFLIGSSDLPR